MDAEAVKWNFERMMEPKTKSAARVFYKDVKGGGGGARSRRTVRSSSFRNEPNYMFPLIVGGLGLVLSSVPHSV